MKTYECKCSCGCKQLGFNKPICSDCRDSIMELTSELASLTWKDKSYHHWIKAIKLLRKNRLFVT